MNMKICELLKPLGIPVLYCTRGDNNNFPLIVFNILEVPVRVMDDIDIWMEYYVNINIIADGKDITRIMKQVDKILLKEKFRKQDCPYMVWDEKLLKYNKSQLYQYFSDITYDED